jgi:hypothetical protein
VAEGDQDHGGVAQTIAAPALLGGSDQPFYLLRREVLAWPNIPVSTSSRRYWNSYLLSRGRTIGGSRMRIGRAATAQGNGR